MNAKELEEKLIADIYSGIFESAMGKLPSEPELIKQYGVTRYALRNALASLVAQGLVYQAQGKGTFIRQRQQNQYVTLNDTTGLTNAARHKGKKLTTISAKLSVVTGKEAHFYPTDTKIDPEEELYFVERLRYLEDQPFVMEYSYYRKKQVPYLDQEIIEGSIYSYLKENVGLNLGFSDKFIYCDECTQDSVAEVLQLTKGMPVLILEDEAYLAKGDLFNFSKLYYHYKQSKFFLLSKVE